MGRVRLHAERQPLGVGTALLDRNRAQTADRALKPIARATLRLQRSAGNQAVTAMLVQRDRAKPRRKPVSAPEPKSSVIVEIPGIGDFGVDSVQPDAKTKAVTVTMPVSKGTVKLYNASTSGKALDIVTIRMRGVTIEMTSVIISSFAFSGAGDRQTATFTFSATKVDYKWKSQKDQPGAGTSSVTPVD